MSYLATEIRIHEENPTKKKSVLYSRTQFLTGDPPRNVIGLVLSSNWVSFVVKTWQPWFGLFSSVASNSNKFCSTQCPEPSKPLVNPPEAKPRESRRLLKPLVRAHTPPLRSPSLQARYHHFERDFY